MTFLNTTGSRAGKCACDRKATEISPENKTSFPKKPYWVIFRGFCGQSECFNLLSGRFGAMGGGFGLGWNPYTQFYMSAELNQEWQYGQVTMHQQKETGAQK